jgi:hypothetical protein
VASQYTDEFGHHIGYCNSCEEEGELGFECLFCDDGEVVPYDDDLDPNDEETADV